MKQDTFVPAAKSSHTVIEENDIIQALDYPCSEYFITTSMYWDCECRENYIKRLDQLMCENCGQFQEDAPSSRINELRHHGFHIDWTQPEWRASLYEHNKKSRENRTPTNQRLRQRAEPLS